MNSYEIPGGELSGQEQLEYFMRSQWTDEEIADIKARVVPRMHKWSKASVDTASRNDPHMKAMGYVFDEPTYRWVKP